jgi:virginiamycin A acetyltransferase
MAKITWGEHSYGDIRIADKTRWGKIDIGKYSSLADDITCFMANDHFIENISTYPFGHPGKKISKLMKKPLPELKDYTKLRKFKVTIGNDVWIGSHTIIFREVVIGDGAVIGAYSKITKDVPPYTIVVGNDRVIKKRFSDEDIEFLLKLKWWDIEDQVVADIAPILLGKDVYHLRVWAKEHNYV